MIRPLIALAALLVAAACTVPEPSPPLPQITFQHLPPLSLDAAAVEISSRYVPPLQPPNVEHQFPTPPAQALRRWAEDRLRAVGDGGRAQFVITRASAVEKPLPVRRGVAGAFALDQAFDYEVSVAAELTILDGRGERLGFATATASRSRSLREDATLDERNRLWLELTEAVMRDFDREMEATMRRHIGAFVY